MLVEERGIRKEYKHKQSSSFSSGTFRLCHEAKLQLIFMILVSTANSLLLLPVARTFTVFALFVCFNLEGISEYSCGI